MRDTRRGLRCRRALSRRIKLFHFGDQPRDGSRDIDRFLLIRQCGPCAGATGFGVHYRGLTERPSPAEPWSACATLIQEFHSLSTSGDWRPAQQEEEAGLAQGKLRRQLRTGRALLALGLRGGECLRRQQSGTG